MSNVASLPEVIGSRPRILAIGGTTRRGSSSEKALMIAVDQARRMGADVDQIVGPDLIMPIFDPNAAEDETGANRLRAAVRQCDGVIVSSAAYHGGIPGVLKNLIDYIDDSDSERPYLAGRAVGSIACAGGWQACGAVLASMRTLVHSLRGWPVPLGVTINSSESVFSNDGACLQADTEARLRELAKQVVEFAMWQRAGHALAARA